MLRDFVLTKYNRDIPIVIWGSKGIGRVLFYLLKKNNVDVLAFVDSFQSGKVLDVQIIKPEELKALYYESKVIILIGVYLYREEIIKKLHDLNIDTYYDAWQILSSEQLCKEELPERDWYLYNTRKYYFYHKLKQEHLDKFFFDHVDIVTTEKCSLKCRDCSNLMQYYKNPVNYNIDILRDQIDRFLNVVDYLGDLRIIGGEPFMNPNLYKLIQYYIGNDKIYTISIWSNATIFPSEKVREVLKSDKIILRFSNYGTLSQALEKWIKFCDEEKIDYIISNMDKWQNLGGLYKRNYSEEMLRHVYGSCECRGLPTFMQGKLYNCPYAAHADNLRVLSPEEADKDNLDFTSNCNHYTADQVRDFLENRQYLSACNYCSGRNYFDGGIEPYIQTKQPLSYMRYDEYVN